MRTSSIRACAALLLLSTVAEANGPVTQHVQPIIGTARKDQTIGAENSGQTYPAVLAGAGEVAVEGFLGGAIGFLEMAEAVEDALSGHDPSSDNELEAILAADAWARRRAQTWIASRQ